MRFLDKYFKETECNNDEQYLSYVYGIMFTSYITKSILETKKNYFIKEKKYYNDIPIIDLANSIYDIENISETNLKIDDMIDDIRLYMFIKSLNYKQKFILFGYYINLYNEIEISKQLGITKQAVSKMKKKILLNSNKYKNILRKDKNIEYTKGK